MPEVNLDAPITLDQLRVFLCVVEAGSFSKAAKRLRRVQSAVSYSIANLERLLDVELFDRSGRTPTLTEAGRALVPDAQEVSERVDRLHARARTLATGLEPRLCLAVDALYPMPALVEGLRAFTDRFEGVDLHLRSEALGAVTQLVLDGSCRVGISVDLGDFPRELTVEPLAEVRLVPVVGAEHALASREGPVGVALLDEAIQIVLTDRSERTAGTDRGVRSPRTWRVADLGTKRSMICAGLGWGLMPAHFARPDLEAGRLRRIDIEGWRPPEKVVMLAIHRTAEPPGPAASWLLDLLREAPEDE